MDLLKDDLKKIYLKYLSMSFGSALISSIYGIVDVAMVGQYHGPIGSAAMSVVAPVWNMMFSLGLLAGMGGSVLYAVQRGTNDDMHGRNVFFTASVYLTAFFSVLCSAAIIFFEAPLLRFFGADEELVYLGHEYLAVIKYVIPVFMFSAVIPAFLRNDGAPGIATKSVLAGGIFNVFGDYFFVFTLDMGIKGAGLATAIGVVVSMVVCLLHFRSDKCTLRLVKLDKPFKCFRRILVTGMSSFVIDMAMGVLTVIFNKQIMKYFDTDALAVYGVIVNISTFVQCCAYGVGEASQPIISQNFGARLYKRIDKTVKYNMLTIALLGAIWTGAVIISPEGFIHLFMSPTESVLRIAPFILRCYATSFPLLLLNIYSTFYFQSVLKPGTSFGISVARGIVISGSLIIFMPIIFGRDCIWLAMTVTEAVVAVFALFNMFKKNRYSLPV